MKKKLDFHITDAEGNRLEEVPLGWGLQTRLFIWNWIFPRRVRLVLLGCKFEGWMTGAASRALCDRCLMRSSRKPG
ncbi:hypothetical protein [Marinobacter salsuginis]|uniref:hypothetical protein n=1 Tax=Marinobacter salsuginis TaxID=418719 RepID=UPI00273F5542|nr:hypothetical protein [Marinobacter salsuginis]